MPNPFNGSSLGGASSNPFGPSSKSGTSGPTATPSASSAPANSGIAPVGLTISTSGGQTTTPLAAGKVWRLLVNVTTPFTGAGAVTLSLGSVASPNLILTGFDLTIQRMAALDLDVAWPVDAPVVATIAGSPSAGAADILVLGGTILS